MPIYEYQCQECNNIVEALQAISDAPLTTCPDCSGTMNKLISQSSFQLKGGGWYSDGYCSTSGSGTKAKPTEAGSSCPKKDAPCGGCC